MILALIVGVGLLLAVGVLSLWQRRAVRDMTAPAPARSAAGPVGSDSDRGDDDRTVAQLGTLSRDDEGTWVTDGSVALGDWHVEVRFIADADGPTPEHLAWARTAFDDWTRLERESLALLIGALVPLGVAPEELEPAVLVIGPMDGGFEGRLEFDTLHDAIEHVYVRSIDRWRHLEPILETTSADADPVVVQEHPLVGRIAYDEDGVWSTPERIALAGRVMHVVLLADAQGPGREHEAWLRAFQERGAGLLSEADALALTTAPDDLQPAGLGDTILVVGPDEDGRFIGGVTYHGSVGGPGSQRKVWSRDRWATLSLERG